MPSLRERREDLPELTAHVLARLCATARRPAPEVEATALEALSRYDFPGNVRELENILERAMALSDGGRIGRDDLLLAPMEDAGEGGGEGQPEGGLQAFLDATERKAILDALARTGRNKTAAARLLGVTFRSLRYRLERLGME